MPSLQEIEMRAQLARRDARIQELEKLLSERVAESEIAQLRNELEQSSERLRLVLLSSVHWQQRAELAELQRAEWRTLAEDLQARLASAACPECGGTGNEPA